MLTKTIKPLPKDAASWRRVLCDQPNFCWKWEMLRPFFASRGYDLYVVIERDRGLWPRITDSPAHGEVWATRDSRNRDVVIKPVSWGADEISELKILKYLNFGPLREDTGNATVPVTEFIEYPNVTFAVMPHWSDCDIPSFANDISHENVQMNYWGALPLGPSSADHAPDFRVHFPVRYALIDFGASVQFPPDIPSKSRRGHWFVGRLHRAPETARKKSFDPFAADVYQAARTVYGWTQKFVDDVPALLALLQDMTRKRPSRQLCALEAHSRMTTIQASIPQHTEMRRLPAYLLDEYDPVPNRISAYVYGTSPY
ncbi:hypothetical protein NEOLEDRAFT_1160868 [Neolentinus lepideus HHB14362 ss-1]|uniref:Protein kinase domain-containing protein n=1 Tax=Neolentinus lepideus HHB14362 ss-1 TaxID=1314782 RepID=A0A165UV37_9AGAM|nr:hypothetical protein NEOLEDRAFT_1160868 [Neolentinus lepideus HHB14362 ss-1]